MATTGGRRRRERRGRRRREKREEKEGENQTPCCCISFPEEIIVEILKRLPVEPLLRFTSVCKSWYSLITSPSFISVHYKQITSTTSKSLLLLRDFDPEKTGKEQYSVHLDDESFEKHKSLDFPARCLTDGAFFRVVGCVNGVVCLSDDIHTYSNDMALWNPSIRKFVFLPQPLITYSPYGDFQHTVGFGFDDTINDFKVVRVVYLGLRSRTPKVEIYEPRVGSWREVDSKNFSHRIDECGRQVFLQGKVHWVVGSKSSRFEHLPNTKKNLVVLFELRTETFHTMEVPDILNQYEFQPDFCVSALGESLSLIHYVKTGHGSTCCVWVKKQYDVTDPWTKLFHVDVVGAPWRVFGFRRSGEALVKSQSRLFSFEPKSKQMKILTLFNRWKSLYVDRFVESLALLGVKGESPGEDSELQSPSELDAVGRCQEPVNSPIHAPWQPVEFQVLFG